LVVVELQSRKLLVLKSVRSECIDEVLACLQELVHEHVAPLALKLDNGSALVSAALAEWCATHGITLLRSPVRRPSYNGTCELSCRWGKHRAYLAARARGAEQLEQQDLDHAVTFRGVMNRISDDVRARFPGGHRRAARDRQERQERAGTCRSTAAARSCQALAGTRGRPAGAPTLPHPDHRRP
jgi:hypothetical protein